MTQFTKKLFLAGVAVLSTVTPLLATAQPSEALFRRSCRDVYLEVENNTGDDILVIDVDYWDPSSEIWRSEPVSNETIRDGRSWQEERNLEKVDQMRTRIRVEYLTRVGSDDWSDEVHQEESETAFCSSDDSEYIITLD